MAFAAEHIVIIFLMMALETVLVFGYFIHGRSFTELDLFMAERTLISSFNHMKLMGKVQCSFGSWKLNGILYAPVAHGAITLYLIMALCTYVHIRKLTTLNSITLKYADVTGLALHFHFNVNVVRKSKVCHFADQRRWVL
jgi:hypothetical protein